MYTNYFHIIYIYMSSSGYPKYSLPQTPGEIAYRELQAAKAAQAKRDAENYAKGIGPKFLVRQGGVRRNRTLRKKGRKSRGGHRNRTLRKKGRKSRGGRRSRS